MKLLILVIFSLCLSACSAMQIPVKMTVNGAEKQFIKALDDFSETNRVELLRQLQRDYPNGAWYNRAQTIILYAQELDNRKLQIDSLRKEKEQQAKKVTQLEITNQELTEKLEQLKGVLIEVEQQPQ